VEALSIRRTFERDAQALVREAKDYSGIVARFNEETYTLILSSSHDIRAVDLNIHVKAARESHGRIDRLICFVPQDCWSDEMPFFTRNGFERQESLERQTSRVALVRDMTQKTASTYTPDLRSAEEKLAEARALTIKKEEWASPFLNISAPPAAPAVPQADPEPSTEVEPPTEELLNTMSVEELDAEIEKQKAALGSSANLSPSYYREFERK
jgi:hypothetical protein